jgi:hypothetical protein
VLPRGPAVPARLVVWDSCGVFRLDTHGRLHRLRRHWLAYHGGGTGRRFGADLQIRRTHEGAYVLRRHGRTIWSSSGLYPNDYTGVAFGPGLFAFGSYTHRGIFLTDLRSPERRVARGRDIFPLGFTLGGQLLVDARPLILVIGRNGSLLRHYRYAPRRGFTFDERKSLLFLVTPAAALAEVEGMRARIVGRAPRIVASPSLLAPGLLAWVGRHGLVVTDSTGRVVASSTWPSALGTADIGVMSSPDAELFAYRLSNLRPGRPRASTAVFVLRRGDHVAHRVFDQPAAQPGCGGVPGGLSWNRHNLLYDFGDGRLVVLDADSGARTNLSAFAKTVPRRDPGELLAFAWASSFTR